MKKKLLILTLLGLASSAASAATASGTAGAASSTATAGTTSTARAVASPRAAVAPMQNATTGTLLQQQQALRQQQIQQAQQQSIVGGLQQSGSAQNVQPQATLNQTTGQAAQPPQSGIATGISASPTAQTGITPGVSQQNTANAASGNPIANGVTTTLNNGALASQVVLPDGTIATLPTAANSGTINNGLTGFGTNASGALIPAVGTVATVPVAGSSAIPSNTNGVVVVQPQRPVPRPAVVVQKTAKPALVMDDLPDAVQSVLKAQLGDGSLYNLEKTTNSSGVIYRASFKNDNKYRQVELTQNGTLVNDNINTPVIAAKVAPTPAQPIKPTSLPQAVLTALKAYGNISEVQNIELVPSKERSVYNIRVNHEGALSELQIAKDGTVIKRTEIDALAPAITTPIPANEIADTAVTGAGVVEIPQAVRNTIQAQGGGTEVRDIQLDTVDGKPVYEVSTHTAGKGSSLQISPDGKILNGQGLAVALTDLPPKVQDAVKDRIGGAIITGIQKEARDGQRVYNVRYNEKNGAGTHLILAENGRPLAVRDSSSVGRPAGSSVSTLQLADLPTAARKTIMNQAGTASMDNVTVRTSHGETVYSATFKKNGQTQTVDVSQNGTLLKPE